MARSARPLTVVASGLLTLAGCLFTVPALAGEDPVDFWSEWASEDAMSREIKADEAMERESNRVIRRLASRKEIQELLIKGEIGVDEATTAYGELNRSSPVAADIVRSVFPGRDDREKTCRQLIAHLRSSEIEGGKKVAAKLESDLNASVK